MCANSKKRLGERKMSVKQDPSVDLTDFINILCNRWMDLWNTPQRHRGQREDFNCTIPTRAHEQRSPPKLVRGLSLLDATMIVVGSMIGSGIFITSAESSRLVGSPGWLLAAWALAGVLTITGALCCAELAAMWPRAGGQYVFCAKLMGHRSDFCSAGDCF
jgi:amino acid permease